jgi:transcriptional regulator with XRE-family HTH domain
VERIAANLLKVARAKAGPSQRELADAAHLAQCTIARIESGTRQPSLPVLAKILAALNLEMRITLTDYDTHDDVLDNETARLSATERANRRNAQDRFCRRRPAHCPMTRDDAFDPVRIISYRSSQPPWLAV